MNRRTFLLVLTAAMAGCGDSEAGGTPSPSPETPPTRTSTPTPTATPIDYQQRLMDRLTARGIDADYLADDGVRARLEYTLVDVTVDAVEATIHEVAMAVVGPIASGWSVEGVDVSVRDPGTGDTIATYRIEALWAKQYDEGTIDRPAYTRKIADTLDLDRSAFATPTPKPSPTPADTGGPPSIDLGSQDAQPDDAYVSIQVDYNHDTAWTVTTDDGSTHEAWTSHKFLALQVRIRNEGDVDFSFYPTAIDLQPAERDTVDYARLEDTSNPLDGVTLAPAEQTEGWIPYQVYKAVTEADLVFDQSVYYGSVACDFDRDESLVVQL